MHIVAEISLFGNSVVGHGWLARTRSGLLGNGTPEPGRDATSTMWLAVDALREEGIHHGLCAIFAPGCEFVAHVDLRQVPSFGSLEWKRVAP